MCIGIQTETESGKRYPYEMNEEQRSHRVKEKRKGFQRRQRFRDRDYVRGKKKAT